MLIVHTTLPDLTSAETLARQLVEQRLAACVHIGAPIQAVYRWQDALTTATEIPLIIKTARHRYDALELYLRAHHSYEVPEIIALPCETVLPSYADWVRKETTPLP